MAHLELNALRDAASSAPLLSAIGMMCIVVASSTYCYLMHRFSSLHAKPSRSFVQEQQNPKTLSKNRVDAIVNRKWKQVLEFVVFHPNELALADKTGHTILHHLCLFWAPIEVIQMALWQCPELASRPNVDGEIPLHWAVRLSAPNECIRSLLKVNRQTATLYRDKQGHSPLSLFWDRSKDSYLEVYMESKEKLLAFRAWKRLELFFQPREDEPPESLLSPLHVAASSVCPPALFPLLIQVYRDQLRVVDGKGRNPLQIACSDPVANRSTDLRTKIQNLIKEDADAAQQTDKEGRTAFLIALEAGIAWKEGLKDLFDLSPNKITSPDPVSRLPPFLLAATGASRRLSKVQVYQRREMLMNCSERSLDTLFRLLKLNPSCIEIMK